MLSEITRRLPVVDLKAQYNGLQDDILAAVTSVLENGHFILGPNVAGLEREIATFCQAPYSVGVASGTDALILALRAAGIQAGDEVIVPAFSFVASADAVSILGATPVFSDIDPVTMNMDVDHAGNLINERTRALIPVHLYGQPADMTAVLTLARNHQLLVIEDCAQALGACWDGKPVGGLGDFGCISFFPTKNLGAYGDGGMITARDQTSAARLKKLRVHGSERKYCHDEQGMNSRLDELQAAILRVKLPHLERWNMERRRVAGLYREALADLEEVNLPSESPSPTTFTINSQYAIRGAMRSRLHYVTLALKVWSTIRFRFTFSPCIHTSGFAKGICRSRNARPQKSSPSPYSRR